MEVLHKGLGRGHLDAVLHGYHCGHTTYNQGVREPRKCPSFHCNGAQAGRKDHEPQLLLPKQNIAEVSFVHPGVLAVVVF